MECPRVLFARFRTGQHHYVYDTYSNNILKASPDAWAALPAFAEGRQDPSDVAAANGWCDVARAEGALEEITSAVRSGFLRPCNIKRMCFSHSDDALRSRIQHHVKHLTLEVTERCNHQCRYCAHIYDVRRQSAPREMSWTTAKHAIDIFAERSRDATTRTTSFWGGEPLLKFNLIRQAVEYINARHPSLRPNYSFTTNATLVTPAIAQFLAEQRFNLLVSVDGPAKAHDRFRVNMAGKGTHANVLRGLELLRREDAAFYADHVRVNCVLTPAADFDAVFDFFASHPLFRDKKVSFHTVNPEGTTFFEDYGRYSREQKERLQQVSGGGAPYSSDIATKRLLPLAIRRRVPLGDSIPLNGCCVPLLKKMLVTVGGDVHMCERMPYDLSLGNVDSGGIDDAQILQMIETYSAESLRECRSCWAVRLCHACFRDSMKNGAWQPARREACERRRADALSSLKSYAMALEEDANVFDKLSKVSIEAPY